MLSSGSHGLHLADLPVVVALPLFFSPRCDSCIDVLEDSWGCLATDRRTELGPCRVGPGPLFRGFRASIDGQGRLPVTNLDTADHPYWVDDCRSVAVEAKHVDLAELVPEQRR